ncbi:SPla/RYanodine receptor (SPRY) domain-containing protein [Rhynchospora pubera]|uniref:SPla/RYanodine receptor (SPRY) domain-containing protein n=1 Tax=Rhynchospora pubera TaxID=906938 RepID=A0AAV8D2X0_9POAL|nr:SPla/RYanodine receptor (SPRY) domain-containing protein [Rhynchospora pubera]
MVTSEESSTPSDPSRIDLERLAARWRSEAEWDKVDFGLDAEPEPSELNTLNSSGLFHVVSTDKMSVRYVTNQHHGHDVGVVQANYPAPTKRIAYYFEMTVKNVGLKGQCSIGFTTDGFKMCRQPGWEVNSCGYHGDDGYLYRGQGKGESFGPTFTSGDTIGAGINYISQEFFFTKNGNIVGSFPKEIKGLLYPTIAVHSQNEELTVNFGKEPFIFDFEAYIYEERLKLQLLAGKSPLQSGLTHWIVRSYLLHYGYQDTLASFENASEANPSSALVNGFGGQLEYALNHRKVLRQFINSGDIDSAFQKLREWYPSVVQDDNSVICFLLHSQRFIEYIRREELEAAVNYGQAHLAKYYQNKAFASLLTDTSALLAYKIPLYSCVGYLLGSRQREFVADAVNAAVLATNPNSKDQEGCMVSCLEKLLRQLTVCTLERRNLADEDHGEAFFLHRDLSWQSRHG